MDSHWRFTTILFVAVAAATLVTAGSTGGEALLSEASANLASTRGAGGRPLHKRASGGRPPHKRASDQCPTCPTCGPCICTPGSGGPPTCDECAEGSFSPGGPGVNCTLCGPGLTSLAGSTSVGDCMPEACIANGFTGVDIPADGSVLTKVVLPSGCANITIDATTAECFGIAVGSTKSAPAAFYYIKPAAVPRHVVLTTCITSARDPATAYYILDPVISLYQANDTCDIGDVATTPAVACNDSWDELYADDDRVRFICADGSANYQSYLRVTLEADTAYIAVTNYWDDIGEFCVDSTVVTTPIITSFYMDPFASGQRSSNLQRFKGSSSVAPGAPLPSKDEVLRQMISAVKAGAKRRASKHARSKAA